MTKIARFAGAAACLATLALWGIMNFANPYGAQGANPGSFLVALGMMLLAVMGLWAAWQARPYPLLAAGLVSFAPVGLYLLGTPGLFRWIGVFNLIGLLSAVGMLVERLSHRRGGHNRQGRA